MMKSIVSAGLLLFIFLGMGFYESAVTLILAVIFLVVSGLVGVIFASYIIQVYSKNHRPPVAGPIFYQLLNFNKLFDYLTYLAKTNITFRMITPTHSEIYTADPVNVEYILKTNFSNYGKVMMLDSPVLVMFIYVCYDS